METLTDTWAQCVEANKKVLEESENLSRTFLAPLRNIEHSVMATLRKQGFGVPPRTAVRKTLETGLEALLVVTNRMGCEATMCTFWHFLNLLWQPILTYIGDMFLGMEPKWSSALETNHKALLLEMEGNVSPPGSALTQDEWHLFFFAEDSHCHGLHRCAP